MKSRLKPTSTRPRHSVRQRAWFLVPYLLSVGALFACGESSTVDGPPELPAIPAIAVEQLGQDVREQFVQIQQRLSQSPIDGHYNAKFARLLHAYSLHAPAAVMYRRCVLLRPGDLECLYLEALTQRHLGNHEQSSQLLRLLLRRKPDFPRAQVVLADTYRQQGQVVKAIPLFEGAIKSDPTNLEAIYGLAMSVMEGGDTDRAKALLGQLHSNGRQFGIVHAALATLNRQQGNLPAAELNTAAATRFADSKIPFVDTVLWAVQDEQVGDQRFVREARTHFEAGRLREAADAYAKAALANPDNATSHNSLIGLYGQLGNMEGAQRHFDQARTLNPNDVKPLIAMGTVQMKRGDFAAAQALFAEVIGLQPSHAEARTLRAYCTELLGGAVLAEEYRRALSADPTQSLAHFLLGRHLRNQQNCVEALPHLRASIRIESARAAAFVSDLVHCLVERGELDEARQTLESGKNMARQYNNASAQKAIEQTRRELAAALENRGS